MGNSQGKKPAGRPTLSYEEQVVDAPTFGQLPNPGSVSHELPAGWRVEYEQSGRAVFFNDVTRSTTFHDPRPPVSQEAHSLNVLAKEAKKGPLPRGWRVSFSKTGQPIYIHDAHQETTFHDPRPASGVDAGTLSRSESPADDKPHKVLVKSPSKNSKSPSKKSPKR